MKKSILIKLIAKDLLAYPPEENSAIHFYSTGNYNKSISFDKEDNEFCFSGWRANNFIDGYWDYVSPQRLESFLYSLSNEDLLILKKSLCIIYDEDAA